MATVAVPVSDTRVFGRQEAIPIASISQATDVISRLIRSSYDYCDIKKFLVRLTIGGRVVQITYAADACPTWADAVFASLAANWGVKQGWDSYNAAPTDPELVAKLLTILFALMKDSSKPPQLIPLADGGIQAEWHSTHDLEVIVSSSEPPRYYFFDPATESDEEGSVLENINRVRALIEKQA